MYREQKVPANTSLIEYEALANSTVELCSDGKVLGTCDVNFNTGVTATIKPLSTEILQEAVEQQMTLPFKESEENAAEKIAKAKAAFAAKAAAEKEAAEKAALEAATEKEAAEKAALEAAADSEIKISGEVSAEVVKGTSDESPKSDDEDTDSASSEEKSDNV